MSKTQPVRRHFSMTLKDFYAEYRKEKKQTLPIKEIIAYKLYRQIMEAFFAEVFKKIIKENFTFMIPYSLGSLLVKAYKTNRKTARVDFPKTKEYKKLIKHLNTHTFNYAFGLKWDKSYTNFKNNSLYGFVTTSSKAAAKSGAGKKPLSQHITELSKDPLTRSYIKI